MIPCEERNLCDKCTKYEERKAEIEIIEEENGISMPYMIPKSSFQWFKWPDKHI